MIARPISRLAARLLLCLVLGVLWPMAGLYAEAGGSWAGLPLSEALRRLEASLAEQGSTLFFTSRVVGKDLKVLHEPTVDPMTEPRRAAEEMLTAHGLGLREISGRLVVVSADRSRSRTDAPSSTPETVEGGSAIDAGSTSLSEEVTVLSRRQGEAFSEMVVRGPEDERLSALPHLANDLFHAAKTVPATSSAESSSRLSVRGGNTSELLVLLDGQEILQPYHLQDFDSALSILAPPIIESASLKAGGFSARYGERMGGVFDLTTIQPGRDLRGRASLAPWYAELGGSGRLTDRSTWMLMARAGSYRLALAIAGRDENPEFWDTFGKMQFALGEEQRHSLHVEVLVAEDELLHRHQDTQELSEYRARWSNSYLWATDLRMLSPRAYVETAVTYGRLARVRRGSVTAPSQDLRLDDVRGYDSVAVRQNWLWQSTEEGAHSLDFGLDIRHLDSDYTYFSERSLRGFLAPLRSGGAIGTVDAQRDLSGDYLGAYISDDWHLGRGDAGGRRVHITAGLRWDDNTLAEDHQLSPRLAVTWATTTHLTLRSSWGVFHQSRRPYELQVEDGESELPVAERAEHVTLGADYRTSSGMLLSAEIYERDLDQLRVRYENLFEPISLFPELSPDRLRVEPGEGRSQGFEFAIRGTPNAQLRWSASYTRSAVTESIAGESVPRAMDQTNALRLEVGHRRASGWQLNAALTYHSGWPTTAVDVVLVTAEDGSHTLEPRLGRLRTERLPSYYRLDLRAGRSWSIALRGQRRGRLEFYLDVQNALDRDNVRGYDEFAATIGPEGPRVSSRELTWGDVLPSFGLSLDF